MRSLLLYIDTINQFKGIGFLCRVGMAPKWWAWLLSGGLLQGERRKTRFWKSLDCVQTGHQMLARFYMLRRLVLGKSWAIVLSRHLYLKPKQARLYWQRVGYLTEKLQVDHGQFQAALELTNIL